MAQSNTSYWLQPLEVLLKLNKLFKKIWKLWPKPICSIIIANKSFSSAKVALVCSFRSSGKNHHHLRCRSIMRSRGCRRSTLPKKVSIVDVYKLEVPMTWLLEEYCFYMSTPGVNVTVPDVHWVNQLAPRVVTNSLLLPQKHQEYTQDKTAQ